MADSQTYDKLAKVLQDIHERFPEDGFSKHQRLRGLLSDHLPEAEREIRIVLDAIDEGVVAVLTDTPPTELGMQVDRLVLRLETSRGIREDIARQVIQAFTYSLGLGGLPSSVVSTPMPDTPPPSAADDWVGVSEAVDNNVAPTPAPAPNPTISTSSVEASAAGQTFMDKMPGGRNGFLGLIALVVVGIIALGGEDPAPQPAGQQGQPQTQPQNQPRTQPTNPQSNPTVQPGATEGLPRVGPGSGQQQPRVNPNNPQVGGGGTTAPRNIPQTGGGTSSVVWYDPYGVVWQLQISGLEFQGVGSQNNAPVMSMAGLMDPPNNQLYYQLFDLSNQQVGEGSGSMTDATHIQFTTYDANGIVIGQGVMHINHPPNS